LEDCLREGAYQTKLISKLEDLFPGCVILKNDASYTQGIPDLIILYKKKWAMLEVKSYKTANTQPNQQYWIDRLDQMSYASFICPDTEEGVLYELQLTFVTRR